MNHNNVGEAFRPPAPVAGVSQTEVGEAFKPPSTWLPVRKPNRLPLDSYRGPGAFFLTLNTLGRIPHFGDASLARQCVDILAEVAARWSVDIHAFCVMPDHLHLLVETNASNSSIIDFVKAFKQQTGFRFRKDQRHRAGGLRPPLRASGNAASSTTSFVLTNPWTALRPIFSAIPSAPAWPPRSATIPSLVARRPGNLSRLRCTTCP